MRIEEELKLQLRVQWDGLWLEDATWISIEGFKALYPNFDVEDKVVSEAVGNYTEIAASSTKRDKELSIKRA